MNADTLSSIVAIALSLGFAYIPGLKTRYTALDSTTQAGVMAVGLVLASLVVFALSCGAFIQVGITCDKPGAVGLVTILINALIANQTAYLLLVRPRQAAP